MKNRIIVFHDCYNIEDYLQDIDGVSVAYKSKTYILGNESIETDIIDWLIEKLNYSERYVSRLYNQLDNESLIFDALKASFHEKFVALDLYRYNHSGISLSSTLFSCSWDGGQIGFVYMTKETARELYGRQYRKRAEQYLEGITKDLNVIAQGNVYGVKIVDGNGIPLDFFGGFIGQDSIIAMKEYIDFEKYNLTVEDLESAFISPEI